jgi:hypothetical protein
MRTTLNHCDTFLLRKWLTDAAQNPSQEFCRYLVTGKHCPPTKFRRLQQRPKRVARGPLERRPDRASFTPDQAQLGPPTLPDRADLEMTTKALQTKLQSLGELRTNWLQSALAASTVIPSRNSSTRSWSG